MYSETDFDRLVAAFWRLATPDELRRMQGLASDAFRGLETSQASTAITKAIQESEKPPAWAMLRRWAIGAAPLSHGGHIPRGMVICIGKEIGGRRQVCGTVFPVFTWCPKCHPEKQGASNEYVIWSQSQHHTVEDWEGDGHTPEHWYSSRDPRPGDHDPILTEPPHITEAKRLLLAAHPPEEEPQ